MRSSNRSKKKKEQHIDEIIAENSTGDWWLRMFGNVISRALSFAIRNSPVRRGEGIKRRRERKGEQSE